MKNLGKIISLMLAVMLVVTLVPTANVEAATIIDSGKCGKKTTYTVTSDGTLTISGQGPMKDCDGRNGEKMPWRNSAETSEIINKVVIENGVTRIGDYAFRGLHYVTNVSIPTSVTEIGRVAFSYCESLEKISIPGKVIDIGPSAFSMCTSLKEAKLPKTECLSGLSIFEGCTSLESFTFTPKDKTVTAWMFDGCTNLKSITLPKHVDGIEQYAFYDCKNLEYININCVKFRYIEWNAFTGCEKLKDIYYWGSKEDWKYTRIFAKNSQFKKAKIHFNSHSHKVTTIKGYPATDTKPGKTDGVYCPTCKSTLTPQKVIPAKKSSQKITTAKIPSFKAFNLKNKGASFNLNAKTTGKGKLSYEVTSYPSGMKKYISVNSKGKVTFKKKAKKGIYEVKVTAAATKKYLKATKKVSIKIK